MITITEEQKIKLIAINELMAKEEVNAVKKYEMLLDETENLVQQKKIWDYNLNLKLSCFTFDEAVHKKYNTEEGDPIFEWNVTYENFIDREPEWNAVDYLRGTILDGFQFCYTFYCILYYSDLSIEEILLIQAVWIDVSVDYQWKVKLIKIPE